MTEPRLQPVKHEFTDFLLYWPGIRVGVKETNLLTGELYLWVDRVTDPGRAELRRMLRVLRTISRPMVCNVSAADARAVRFAEFFGFKSVIEQDGILIMARN